MSNLFSIFDPSAIFLIPLNWVAIILFFLFFPVVFWLQISQLGLSYSLMLRGLFMELKAIMGSVFIPGILLLNLSVFLFIWFNNFLGLVPYVFTGTSHLSMTLSLALPLWAGHVVYAWFKTTEKMLAHLVPSGSPMGLAPFMVLIEMVSSIIRPVTLAVRLAANMVAGHLLMVLLSTPLVESSKMLLLFGLIPLVMLFLLEVAVATIQAYVFSVLSALYVSEVASSKMVK